MNIKESKYKDGRKKYIYEFRYYKEHHTGTCKGCNSFAEAQEYVADLMKKISDSKRGLIDLSKQITLSEVFELFLENSKNKNSHEHYMNQERDCRKIIEYFGKNTVVADITEAKILNFREYQRKKDKISKNTANHIITTFKSAINFIILEKRLSFFNPCRLVKPYKFDVEPPRPITVEEWNKLKNELAPHLLLLCQFQVQTGLRPTQVRNLIWERIHLDTNTPYIQILQTDKGNKSKKPYKVPISKALLKIIQNMGVKKEGYIFTNPNTGKPYNDNRTGFNKALERAGLPRDIVMYNLKDSVGTTLARNNVAPITIKNVFNHSDITISEKYIGAVTQDTVDAMETLKDYI